jgi:hypothetical protein
MLVLDRGLPSGLHDLPWTKRGQRAKPDADSTGVAGGFRSFDAFRAGSVHAACGANRARRSGAV